MDRNDLLNSVIDDGIEEVRHLYTRPDQKDKHDGAMEGFEACRGLSDSKLLALFKQAQANTLAARAAQAKDYWRVRYKELQVEWVLDVLSAAMLNDGQQPLITPTGRGMKKAADILGVASA
jgi:hypothetical protein